MNERIWEGIIQVLRKDEAPLTATARLWRRDDFFGTDWGGQLEIPIALRRALPPGEYTLVLAPGREAVAFIGLGPSNAASTFPTVTGTSAPPFGAAPAATTTPTDDDLDDEDEATIAELVAEAQAATADEDVAADEARVEKAPSTSRGSSRKASTARAASKPAAPPVASPPPPAEQPRAVAPAPVDPPAQRPEEPLVPESAPATPIMEAFAPLPFVPPGVGLNGHTAEGIARTERLARAFLAAMDTHQRMQSVNATGVEGHLFASARTFVDELAGLIESRLHGSHDPATWLGQRLAVIEWFGSALVSVPGRPDLVEVGQSLIHLSRIMHATVNEPQAVAA